MRRKDREITASEEFRQILEACKVLQLGLIDGAYPYIVPLHYGYEYDDASNSCVFYMHSAREGHKLDLIRENPNAFVELAHDIELVSGGEVPCQYGSIFASIMGRGQAEIVDDVAEKIHGLKLLMVNQTGREFEIDEKMAGIVEVIKVTATDLTAKAHKRDK